VQYRQVCSLVERIRNGLRKYSLGILGRCGFDRFFLDSADFSSSGLADIKNPYVVAALSNVCRGDLRALSTLD
jgi:hypothetical protein